MQPNSLQRLIIEHCERTGETYTDVAERAKMPRQTVSAIVNRPTRSLPHEDTLRRLARGLGLPYKIVHDAALESVTIANPPPPPAAAVLVQLVETMGERDVLILLATARALVSSANGSGKR